MRKLYFLIALGFAMSCGKANPESLATESVLSSPSMDKVVHAEAPPSESNAGSANITAEEIALEKKIIKTADLVFESKDLDASSLWVKQLVQKNQGYIASETSEGNEYQPSITFLIRIPSGSFNQLLSDVSSKVNSFDRKSIERKDVTEEYIDIESRLKTKKELENRYLEILKQAKTVSDILEIENKLAVIREEVEATEGRLKYLQSQVAMSTVHINIYKKIAYSPTQKESFFSPVGTALVQGFYYLTDFFIGLLYIWPFIIIISLVFYFVFKRLKKRRQTK